jgi:hypothetical protein
MISNSPSPQLGPSRFVQLLTSFLTYLVLLGLLSLILLPMAHSAQLTLAWDPNTEADLAGYKIYYGTASGVYGSPINVGNVTTYTLTGLIQGQTYFITATACDTSNNESGYSNELNTVSLATSVNPAGAGTVNPTGVRWYNSGQTVSISATASPGYMFSGWSGDLSGLTNASLLVMNGPKNVTANFTSVSSGSLSVTPSDGLSSSGSQGGPFSPSLKIYTLQNTGGSAINWSVSKTQGWVTLSSSGGSLASGASTTVTVSITSNANNLGAGSYNDTIAFSNITNGNGNTSRSVALVVNGTGQQTFTVATNPSGLQVTVDGSTYTAPQSFSWAPGSSHTLSVPSPQSGVSGVRYVFASWSDVGGLSHTITTPSSSATYIANLTTQYSLTTSVNPVGAGTVNPSGVSWYNSGQTVSVSATASSGYAFSSWSGDLSSSTTPSSVLMNGPMIIAANFTQNQYTLTVNIAPAGAGSVTKNPNKATYGQGEAVQLTATTNAGYTFSNWSGDASGSINTTTVTMNGNKNVTADFSSAPTGSLSITPSEGLTASGSQGGPFSPSSKVYTIQNMGGSVINWSVSNSQGWVILSSNGGSLVPGASTIVTVSINSNASNLGAGSYSDTVAFKNTTDGNGNTSRSIALVVSGAGQQGFTVVTNPPGLQVTVDDSSYTAPQRFSWAPGSSHTLSVPTPQSGASGVRYVFASWSDAGGLNHTIIAPSSSATDTASLMTQYRLTTSVNPAGTGTVNPSGISWYNSGQTVSVFATANSGYTFSGWSGDLSGANAPSSVVMKGPKNVTGNFSSQIVPPSQTVSRPKTPQGRNKGTTGRTYTYTTGGSISDSGDTVEYQFDWKGDGTDLSAWGSAKQSNTWTSASIHYVRARARRSSDPSVVSDWSDAILVSVTEKPFIEVTSPSGGETYLVGTSHPISWTSGYLNPAGTIYLFYWYDRQWHPIAALPSSANSYDWTISDVPPGLGSVIPSSRIKKASVWIGNRVGDRWECWGLSESFKILDEEWILTISGADKGGMTIQFGESTFGGWGLSFGLGMFEIGGAYSIHADGVMDGTYTIYDIHDKSVVLESGNFSGAVNSLVTAMKLGLNKSGGEPLFNMSGVRLIGEPKIPSDWKVRISGGLQGTFDLLTIQPYQVGEDVYSYGFTVSASGSIPSGLINMEGYFFFTNAKGKNAYGVYTITGAMSETGVFSGKMNPNPTSGTFQLSAACDNGNKYTFNGQVVTP